VTRFRPEADGRGSDLPQAFATLGRGPSFYELGRVCALLREAGITEVEHDDDLVALAERNGSNGFVALDLSTALTFGVQALRRGPKPPEG
jgi:hypothetical protein